MFCRKCLEFFKKELLVKDDFIDDDYCCPVKSCGYPLIEIDDALKFIIRSVYSIDLETVWSCSGHFHDKNHFSCYITFCQDVGFNDYPNPPEYHVDINDLYKICERLSKSDSFKNFIEVDTIKKEGMTRMADWGEEVEYESLRIRTITESDYVIKDRIEIQSKFLIFLNEVLTEVYFIIEDMRINKNKDINQK